MKGIKLSDVFLLAAEYHDSIEHHCTGCCYAISHTINPSGLKYVGPAFDLFKAYFPWEESIHPWSSYKSPNPDREARVLALLFMHEITKDEAADKRLCKHGKIIAGEYCGLCKLPPEEKLLYD